MVVVEEEELDVLMPVDGIQIECWQMLTLSLGIKDSVPHHSGCHSICVIPGTILAEFEFHSTFCWNGFINLEGLCAKLDSSGIPGIAWILAGISGGQ